MKITFLGTGTSHGVPAIDCMMNNYERCPQGVCRASLQDPLHARTRCSLLIEKEGRTILIDTSLDFRSQMLANKVKQIDAVLFTHAHADHIGGLPDIRSYTRNGTPLPVYGSGYTIQAIRKRFEYIFDPPEILGGGVPELETHSVCDCMPFRLFGNEIVPAEVTHGSMPGCFGYRIGPVGYISDLKFISGNSRAVFKGLEVLILNALRRAPEHETHLTLDQAVELALELKCGRCFFTHLSHDIHYEADGRYLPENMTFAYDGQSISI